MKSGPCYACPRRRPGCHSAGVCEAWSAYEKERAAAARPQKDRVLAGYVREAGEKYRRRKQK